MQIGYPGGGGGGGGILIFHIIRVYISSFLFFYYCSYNFFFFLGGGGAENLIFMEKVDFVAHFYAFTGVFLSSRYRTGIHFVGI